MWKNGVNVAGLSVKITYTNHRGTTAVRHITPSDIMFMESPYHRGHQWFLSAWDHDKQAHRTFTMKDIHSWEPYDDNN